MNMWILWLLLIALTSISVLKEGKKDGRSGYSGSTRERIDNLMGLSVADFRLPTPFIIGFGGFIVILALFNDLTYASWVGSILGFLGLLLMFQILAIAVELFILGKVGMLDDPGRFINVKDITPRDVFSRSNPVVTLPVRVVCTILIFLMIIIANITPYTGNLGFNPVFEDLEDSEHNTEECDVYLTDIQDVRVIS